MAEKSFESLVLSQSDKLRKGTMEQFIDIWKLCAHELLEYYDLDRLTVFPNSVILLRDHKTLSYARNNTPSLQKQDYLSIDGNHERYLKLLNMRQPYREFNEQSLKTTDQHVLRRLYQQGGRWHAIIPLHFFGAPWGAISVANFGRGNDRFNEQKALQIRVVAEMWLCFWQYAGLHLGLRGNDGRVTQDTDNELMVKLSDKQTKILSLMAQGLSAKECGDLMFISPRTVESHKYRLQNVLGLSSKAELVQFALRNGLGSTLNNE